MAKFICNKIGRDNIETFHSEGITPKYKLLKGTELQQALKCKLMEEAHEVQIAETSTEIIAELADILEVVDAICKAYQIVPQAIMLEKEKKYKMRGGFEKGVYIETIEMADNNPKVKHFRKEPAKYPEI